jgi:hypothetical protein
MRIPNKAALSVSFDLGTKSFLFINCHLEAHEENRERRMEQWMEVMKKIIFF